MSLGDKLAKAGIGVAKMPVKAAMGVGDRLGLTSRLGTETLEDFRKGFSYQTGRLAAASAQATVKGAWDVANAVPTVIKNADRLFLNKSERNMSNLLGRTPKPWFLGALAFGVIAASSHNGSEMYTKGTTLGAVQPEMYSYDGIQPLADDLGSTGIVQALHNKRHG